MYGDKMYCETCKRIFKDTETFFDTRDGQAKNQENGRLTKGMGKHTYRAECPHCRSIYTLNATKILEEGDMLSKIDPGLKNWQERNIYKMLKEITKKDTFI